ncbi:MAG: hypothetical protein ACI89L_000961 [Phycisphaerales bacterium]|jgi:hypothetical protein
MRVSHTAVLVASSLFVSQSSAQIFVFNGPGGLAAEAEFTLINPTTLEVRLKNISTGVPLGFSNSDQLLTGISWDFGIAGVNDPTDAHIIGGFVEIGSSSFSVDFDTGSYGSGTDVSGEFGYGNNDGSGMKLNFFSANSAGATSFGGPNLDGPAGLDGPQPGLISSAFSLPLGGLGAIQDEVVATLTLDQSLTDLSFLWANGMRVEFGSDAAFITIPTPASAALLGLGGLLATRRRR